MKIEIEVPDIFYKLMGSRVFIDFKMFYQSMTNRKCVGHLRYGPPQKRQQYIKRLELELKSYKRTGNFEALINIANYAFLESQAPSNKKFHFDPAAASNTRDKMGI